MPPAATSTRLQKSGKKRYEKVLRYDSPMERNIDWNLAGSRGDDRSVDVRDLQ